MTVLVDTGPIVAQLDRSQANHEQCVQVMAEIREPIVTCEAVITEACYLLRRVPGATVDLLKDVALQRFVIGYNLTERSTEVARLMSKYNDVPMDLADACLVDMANQFQTGRILTLDSDFQFYRWGRNRPFDVLLEI